MLSHPIKHIILLNLGNFFSTGGIFSIFQVPLKHSFLLKQFYFLAFKPCTKLRGKKVKKLSLIEKKIYRSYVKLNFKHNLFHTIFAKHPFFYQKRDIYRHFFG